MPGARFDGTTGLKARFGGTTVTKARWGGQTFDLSPARPTTQVRDDTDVSGWASGSVGSEDFRWASITTLSGLVLVTRRASNTLTAWNTNRTLAGTVTIDDAPSHDGSHDYATKGGGGYLYRVAAPTAARVDLQRFSLNAGTRVATHEANIDVTATGLTRSLVWCTDGERVWYQSSGGTVSRFEIADPGGTSTDLGNPAWTDARDLAYDSDGFLVLVQRGTLRRYSLTDPSSEQGAADIGGHPFTRAGCSTPTGHLALKGSRTVNRVDRFEESDFV